MKKQLSGENDLFVVSFLYLCGMKLRKECILLEMSVC